MIDFLLTLSLIAALTLPYIFFSPAANIKKSKRHKQLIYPPFAILFCIVAAALFFYIDDAITSFLQWLPSWCQSANQTLQNFWNGNLSFLGNFLSWIGNAITTLLSGSLFNFLRSVIANAAVMLVYIIYKGIVLGIERLIFKQGGFLFEKIVPKFYDYDEIHSEWFLKAKWYQARTFLKAMYCLVIILAVAMQFISKSFYSSGLLVSPFYPAFGVIIISELYYVLVKRNKPKGTNMGYDDDGASTRGNYAVLRRVLRKLFGDVLLAEDTDSSHPLTNLRTDNKLIEEVKLSENRDIELYSSFMEAKLGNGFELDQNYFLSGKQLLEGHSIVFNNPFYYDLIPYVFYPMNTMLLKHRKILILLGRHGMTEDAVNWCRSGFFEVTGIQDMWRVGCLEKTQKDIDVGIITRSSIHDAELHAKNKDFFAEVGFVFLIEPSRLLTTAQIGVKSIIKMCQQEGKNITFCSTDKNCDGLVDSLSHILQTNITEVSATDHHKGVSSYMCWESSKEYLQHRMLPNLSHYLGIGTELSFVALKNQVDKTYWYGGEAFPVVDMHWIAKQYYYDLLNYAGLPVSQDLIDELFFTTHNIWESKKVEKGFMTVEDESFNMFEIKRLFASRTKTQGFINVISTDYILKDYMAENNSIFNADSKAIPYIVADYNRTVRNVLLMLCLRMSSGFIFESELKSELMIIGDTGDDIKTIFWRELCSNCCISSQTESCERLLNCKKDGKDVVFTSDIIRVKRKFSPTKSEVENVYYITDTSFISIFLHDLQNAVYMDENEKDPGVHLGIELYGSVLQKYLPGQLFTFEGKYYQMQKLLEDGRVMVHRAADLIDGRPEYRHIRNYCLSNLVPSLVMGDTRQINDFRISKMYADIVVDSLGYWELDKYNDFAHGKKVLLNDIPKRTYYKKQLLKIEFPCSGCNDEDMKEIVSSITVMMNEIFRTLFAENHPYISALYKGVEKEPATYFLSGDFEEENPYCIYIVEDSQLDLGLLSAVERNMDRILKIITDYLDWHLMMLTKKDDEGDGGTGPIDEGEPLEVKKKKGIFKRIWDAIKNKFKKLFGKKKKKGGKDDPKDGTDGTEGETEEPKDGTDEQNKSESVILREDLRNVHGDAGDGPGDVKIEFDPAGEHKKQKNRQRPAYKQRCYLYYGGESEPENINAEKTYEYLKALGYANNRFKQAREGKDLAFKIEMEGMDDNFNHVCDFCGVNLSGVEYDILADGRERCVNCGRTAVKSEEEFDKLFKKVRNDMDLLFGVKINVPITVSMVSSEKIQKILGRKFVPTPGFDSRTIGLAVQKGGEYTVYIENGAPYVSSLMTMCHELTHIWQYIHWNRSNIIKKYGKENENLVYEGMARWVEIQYAYLINESERARRLEMITNGLDDDYGRGYRAYLAKYPMSRTNHLEGETPFDYPNAPL